MLKISMPTGSQKSSDRIESAEFGNRYSVMAPAETLRRKAVPIHFTPLALQPRPHEPTIAEDVVRAFLNSGYPLHHVSCHVDDSKLVLHGQVNRYYYLQVAIQIALRMGEGRRIVNNVEVITLPPLCLIQTDRED